MDDPRYPNGIDTVPAMLTKGERVFGIAESAAIRRLYGDITNQELVNLLTMPELSQTWADMRMPYMNVPRRIEMTSAGAQDMTALLNEMQTMSKAMQNLRQVHVSVDKNGVATWEQGLNGVVSYFSNLVRR